MEWRRCRLACHVVTIILCFAKDKKFGVGFWGWGHKSLALGSIRKKLITRTSQRCLAVVQSSASKCL